ncbi:MAG: hypothetical protein K1X64_06360 [Myxococcaceae bacterium]|nr:hypothetical protein [Myxococcaceae bacterium]
MNRNVATSVFALCAGLCLSGCPSFLVQGRARPLSPGRMQVQVTPHGNGVLAPTGIPAVMPGLELAVRRGMTQRFDLGVKLWLGGLTVDSKIALRRSDTPHRGIDWAVAPGIGYATQGIGNAGITPAVHAVDIHLPLLVGFNFANGYGLVVGPRLTQRISVLVGTTALTSYALAAGSSVGLDVPLTSNVHLFPEVALYLPLIEAAPHMPVASPAADGLGFQIALGVLIGGHE